MYQTGVPVAEVDLLQSLVTFLASAGWTVNRSSAQGNGWKANVSKGGVYVNLRAMVNENGWGVFTGGLMNGIGLSVGTGYDSSHDWVTQAGVPQFFPGGPYAAGVQLNTMSAIGPSYSMSPFTRYHFFSDAADNIVVVLERAPNNFGYLGWGSTLVKTGGVWTGGLFCFADCDVSTASQADGRTAPTPGADGGRVNGGPSLFVRADVDSYAGKFLANYIDSETTWGKSCASGVPSSHILNDIPSLYHLYPRLTSLLNAQAVLIPINIFAHRDGGGYSLLGAIPNVFLCNAGGVGFGSGSVYVVGASRYMIFQGAVPPVVGATPGFAIEQFL